MSDLISMLEKTPDEALVDALETLIKEVVSRLDQRLECRDLIARINKLSGRSDYDENTFFELYAAMEERDFAEIAARGSPPIVADIPEAELVQIIQSIREQPGAKSRYMLEFLQNNFPVADVSDLIYWPHKQLTTDAIAEEIRLRTSLLKSGGIAAVDRHKRELAQGVLADPNAPMWAKEWAMSFRPSDPMTP